TGARLRQELDNAFQRDADLPCHVGRIAALLVAGLPRQDDPAAGRIHNDAVRKTTRLRPFGRLQDLHQRSPVGYRSPGFENQKGFSTDIAPLPTSKSKPALRYSALQIHLASPIPAASPVPPEPLFGLLTIRWTARLRNPKPR